jgi:ubiquinone/menaquinone biosynthesis C-methylase UbiE
MKPFDAREMRRHWESEASDYTKGRKFSSVDARIVELVKRHDGDRILEVGIGPFLVGEQILRACPDCRYFGIDFAEPFLEIAARRTLTPAAFIKADAAGLPFRSECLDVILEMDTIHHFPLQMIPQVIKEIVRPLKIGGAYISAEDWASPPLGERDELVRAMQKRRHTVRSGLEYHPSDDEWIAMLEGAGLEIRQIEHLDRPMNLERMQTAPGPKTEIEALRGLWGDVSPTTKMTIFICEKG